MELFILVGMAIPGLGQGATDDPSPEHRQRARELVKQAGHILHPPAKDGEMPMFDPSVVLDDGERFRRSVVMYNEALALWPECIEALLDRSMSHYFLEDIEAAKRDAKSALALDPDERHYLLLSAPFQGTEAREILLLGMQKVGPASPLYEMLWGRLATTYFYEGDFAGQARELEALLAKDPSACSVHRSELGGAYEALGEVEKAEVIYEEGLPDTADCLIRLRMQGETDAALATLDRVRPFLESDDALIYGALIKALGGQPIPEILQAFEALKRQGEGNLFGVDGFAAGVLLLSSGETHSAHLHLRNFLEMVKSNPTEWGVTMRWRADKARHLLTHGLPVTGK